MNTKKHVGKFAAIIITAFTLLLLTSPLWIGWIMEHEHNKTKFVLIDYSLKCEEGAHEERGIWSKLGIAIYCVKKNKKHGAWEAWDGGYRHISGYYIENKKHGNWKYFNARGEQWGERLYSYGIEVTPLKNLLAADLVVVEKNLRTLDLIKNNKVYRTFKIRLGSNPIGHKQQEGDERTPEGEYVLEHKSNESKYYRSIFISYPNKSDMLNAQKIKVNPGGNIMIHGQPNYFGWAWRILSLWNWTNGSIALNNQDMDEIWELVDDGTSIIIKP